MTSAPSPRPENLPNGGSMSSAAGSPARTSASPAGVPDLRASDPVYTASCSGSFAFYDLGSSSWRTWQRSWVEDWELYSETWPRAGMTRSGIAYRLRPLVPLTCATASSLWVGTPTALSKARSERFRVGSPPNPAELAGLIPTPTVNDAKNSTLPPSQRGRDSLIGYCLRGRLPTPKASDGERGGRGDLLQAAKGKVPMEGSRRWRTPTVTDAIHPGQKAPSKPGQQVRLTQQVNAAEEIPGVLNPSWVEWLMGFPIGWTGCGDSETPSCPRSPSGLPDA